MKISLPDNYKYKNSNSVYVENGVLYIRKMCNINPIMYDLALYIRNPKECFYCSKSLAKSKNMKTSNYSFRTIDHLYPRDLGGPTIPANLVPCCPCCNYEKGNLTEQDFRKLRTLSEAEKQTYKDKAMQKYEEKKQLKESLIPLEWVEYVSPSKITIAEGLYSTNDVKKIQRMYKTYGNIFTPILVDKNYVLLDGYSIIYFIDNYPNSIDLIPIIRIENIKVQHVKALKRKESKK